jgi:hypothetical protein
MSRFNVRDSKIVVPASSGAQVGLELRAWQKRCHDAKASG